MPWVCENGISVWQGRFEEPTDDELAEYGYIETRTAEHLRAEREEVLRMRSTGMTYAQIGRALLLPESTVANMLTRITGSVR